MIPHQEEGERGGCRMTRKGGGMVSEGRERGVKKDGGVGARKVGRR